MNFYEIIMLLFGIFSALIGCFLYLKNYKNKLKQQTSEFISIATHQLRTPLTAIKWSIKMILDGDVGKLNQEQQELLSKGYQSNERVIKLINDLLDVSRIEEKKFDYQFDKYDFKNIIDTAIERLQNLIIKKHLKIKFNKPIKSPKIYVDKEKILLVLQNLLANAMNYSTENGIIKIDIKIKNKFLLIYIKDNGVGIPKNEQFKLFSKFFRASNIMKFKTQGSGLGLFITKNIIEKHGGRISIKSQEGKGTEVCFSLPILSSP